MYRIANAKQENIDSDGKWVIIHTLSDLASKLYHTVDPSDWSQFYSEKGGKDEIRICM